MNDAKICKRRPLHFFDGFRSVKRKNPGIRNVSIKTKRVVRSFANESFAESPRVRNCKLRKFAASRENLVWLKISFAVANTDIYILCVQKYWYYIVEC